MPGLKLRDEFLGAQMPGTSIALRAHDNTGAAQQSAEHILSIIYPTADVLIALRALGAQNAGRPVVLIGQRGRGKSHIMAVMHHALALPETVEAWLKSWEAEIGGGLPVLRRGYLPISEPVHEHEYFFLWDLLFERHPKGQYYKGQFEHLKQPVPPKSLLAAETGKRPPENAEPASALYLRLFGGRDLMPRDELHKTLRGTGFAQEDLEARGWIRVVGKEARAVPIAERFAFFTARGRTRKALKTDLDQAHFLIGAALPGSGLRIDEELARKSFVLKKSADDILGRHAENAPDEAIRVAAATARQLVAQWRAHQAARPRDKQLSLFERLEEGGA